MVSATSVGDGGSAQPGAAAAKGEGGEGGAMMARSGWPAGLPSPRPRAGGSRTGEPGEPEMYSVGLVHNFMAQRFD